MDNELMNEEMTEQNIDETPGADESIETGGEEQGSESPAVPADDEQQKEQTMTEITGTVTVDNLFERPIMSTPFSQYTVTEGLLLLSLLLGLVRTLFRIWNN